MIDRREKIILTPPVEDAAARCPVEPGTLRVFNRGAMRHALCALPIPLGWSLLHWGPLLP
jgi:hypothetical protein